VLRRTSSTGRSTATITLASLALNRARTRRAFEPASWVPGYVCGAIWWMWARRPTRTAGHRCRVTRRSGSGGTAVRAGTARWEHRRERISAACKRTSGAAGTAQQWDAVVPPAFAIAVHDAPNRELGLTARCAQTGARLRNLPGWTEAERTFL
jgi:hypothetical protein